MPDRKSRTINIVGGGSAGWMTALYLNRYFNGAGENFVINVIESPDIGIIGVGEATVHSIRFFFRSMGLDEAELMAETNATVKSGILFRNWKKPVDDRIHEYFHPFDQQQVGGSVDLSTAWLTQRERAVERYDEGVSLSANLAREGRCAKTLSSPHYQGMAPYGYHLDAILMAKYLRRKAVEAGVGHIEATVSDAVIEDGCIRSVVTDKGLFSGDIFIDCTGFRGMLIGRLQEDNWISFADALPCNRAVAVQRSLPEGRSPRPYTVATALSSGWAWQIDLTNRQGSGYVYDGNRLAPEEAERELLEFLGQGGDGSEVLRCNHLEMKVGCRRQFWVGNCIAVGLAGGFIEPLESTGLHMIHLGVGLAATHLASGGISQVLRNSYNDKMNGFYQDLKQFIVLHYCLSDRDDSDFWRSAPATVDHCPWLKAQLQLWSEKICEFQDFAGTFASIFSDLNYRYVLYGMQHYPRLGIQLDKKRGDALLGQFRAMADRAVANSLHHSDFLQFFAQGPLRKGEVSVNV